MPDDDWALGQNEVDVRNEARRAGTQSEWWQSSLGRHGFACQDPEEDWVAMLADDPDLHLVTSDPAAYDRAHPCSCDGTCTCESRAVEREDT